MTVTALEAAGWFAVSLVTLLGDPLVIGGLAITVYWFGDWIPWLSDRLDNDRAALLLASVVGALALSAALKTGLAVTRPAGATELPGVAGMPEFLARCYTWIVDPGGYAFPSGHAVAATVGWVGLAWVLGDDDRRPIALAGVLVAAIATSRVVLGVHRRVDVVAGIAVGLAVLFVTVGLLKRARRGFALAGLVGGAGPVAVSLSGDSLLAASVALGMATGWETIRARGRAGPPRALLAAAVAIAVAVGATFLRAGGFQAAVATVGIAGGGLAVATGLRGWNDESG